MHSLIRYKGIAIISFLLMLSIVSGYRLLWMPSSETPQPKVVYIKKGMPLKQISELLAERQVIRNRHVFVFLATVLGKKTRLKAGEYEFQSGLTPLEVMDTLAQGQVKHHLITIPEGYTLTQIAQLLEEQKVVTRDDFLKAASSPALMMSLGFSSAMIGSGATLEGYLFPETYHLYRDMEPEEVIKIMAHQFKKVIGADFESNKTSEAGISERDAVILASIIEKETALPEEKPLISAVFRNRLARRMPLQSDPTVIYGIKDFNGNLTREDLLRPTPFNTYLRAGLPPTPICSPGKDSLLAALHPASVPYLYFVSKNDGSHYFSTNIGDHSIAVWHYQKSGRKNSLTKK